jgi:hypothetical protein
MDMSQGYSLYNFLKQTNVFFQKWRIGEQNRSCLGVGSGGRGEDIRRGYRRVNVVEIFLLMYENGKVRPFETVSGVDKEE